MSFRGGSATARAIELRAAAAAILLALTLGACGSGESEADADQERPEGIVDISGTDPVGEMRAGSVAPLAQCRDWRRASEEERLATIADIRRQLNPEDSSIEGPELTDQEAEEMFDTSCKPSWAAGFRLYKLYSRAVGFVELKRVLDP